MRTEALEDVSRRTTREQPPDPELRAQCAKAIQREATRLDVAYRLHMEAVSRARAEEAALLVELIQHVRPALPALTGPVLLRDVSSPGRPALVHLRAFLLFGEAPSTAAMWSARRVEGLFLLDDMRFLRVCFTGGALRTGGGQLALAADGLQGLDARGVLRDHSLADVTDVLATALCAQTARRRAQVRNVEAHVGRLQALRVLLAR
jgi:hypothetical protein